MSICVCKRTEFNDSMTDSAIVGHCHICGDVSWVMSCNCGGVGYKHPLGVGDCMREKVHAKPRKISGEDDKWFVEGHTITGFTLRQQRGYHLHDCGSWSRPKDHESTNSLPDET